MSQNPLLDDAILRSKGGQSTVTALELAVSMPAEPGLALDWSSPASEAWKAAQTAKHDASKGHFNRGSDNVRASDKDAMQASRDADVASGVANIKSERAERRYSAKDHVNAAEAHEAAADAHDKASEVHHGIQNKNASDSHGQAAEMHHEASGWHRQQAKKMGIKASDDPELALDWSDAAREAAAATRKANASSGGGATDDKADHRQASIDHFNAIRAHLKAGRAALAEGDHAKAREHEVQMNEHYKGLKAHAEKAGLKVIRTKNNADAATKDATNASEGAHKHSLVTAKRLPDAKPEKGDDHEANDKYHKAAASFHEKAAEETSNPAAATYHAVAGGAHRLASKAHAVAKWFKKKGNEGLFASDDPDEASEPSEASTTAQAKSGIAHMQFSKDAKAAYGKSDAHRSLFDASKKAHKLGKACSHADAEDAHRFAAAQLVGKPGYEQATIEHLNAADAHAKAK